mmetsp:Transcript_66773/g.177714  ORF Transcript_66773/g.177714 Transcript_66773/m.177714 type:complete len:202 (+) Transcript_66773:488-1093(+)
MLPVSDGSLEATFASSTWRTPSFRATGAGSRHGSMTATTCGARAPARCTARFDAIFTREPGWASQSILGTGRMTSKLETRRTPQPELKTFSCSCAAAAAPQDWTTPPGADAHYPTVSRVDCKRCSHRHPRAWGRCIAFAQSSSTGTIRSSTRCALSAPPPSRSASTAPTSQTSSSCGRALSSSRLSPSSSRAMPTLRCGAS